MPSLGKKKHCHQQSCFLQKQHSFRCVNGQTADNPECHCKRIRQFSCLNSTAPEIIRSMKFPDMQKNSDKATPDLFHGASSARVVPKIPQSDSCNP